MTDTPAPAEALSLDEQLALVKPFADRLEGAQVFVDVQADEDGYYPSHLAVALPYQEQIGENEWQENAEIHDLTDLSEAGELWRDVFYLAAQDHASALARAEAAEAEVKRLRDQAEAVRLVGLKWSQQAAYLQLAHSRQEGDAVVWGSNLDRMQWQMFGHCADELRAALAGSPS